MDINEVSSKTNFDAVKSYIENIIIKDSNVVSMRVLQHVYEDDSEDKHYRHKLKQKIQKELPGILQFVQPSNLCAEVVFSKSIFDKTKMPWFEPQSNIVSVAKQLREDIISYCNTVPEHKWSPTFESDSRIQRSIRLTQTFSKKFTTEKSRTNREKACLMIDSVTSDFINNISNRKIITPKYLLALGWHILKGPKQPVVIANQLGDCMSYDPGCEVETSLSEAAILKSKETSILPIRPEDSQIVMTVFWVDNFDITVKNDLGGGAVNKTHHMTFQKQAHHDKHLLHVPVERTRKRKSSALEDHEHIAFTAGTVAEPPRVTVTGNQDLIYDDTSFQHAQFVLIYFVKCNYCYDQAVPNVLGCRQALRKVTTQELQKNS